MNLQLFICKMKSGIYRDFILSLFASAVTTIAAQIVTYPVLAKLCSSEEYGRILTIMGVGNVITLAFGNSLNNARLVLNTEYEEKQEEGDFMPLLWVLTTCGAVAYIIYLCIFGEASFVIITSLACFAAFGIMQNYGSVAFRIKINYVRNLVLAIVIAIGNIVGLGIFYFTRDFTWWAITFALGQVFGVVYIFCSSKIYRERCRITSLFKKTFKKESVLIFTTACANILVYLDRLLLYPLLGGDAVSTYTVASFFGKSLAILMNPISGVLLSYYSQKNYGMDRKRFWKGNVLTLTVSGLFMLFSLIASVPVTGILYPSLVERAKPYLFIANLAAVTNVVGNMAQPAVLKYAKTHWLAINQITYMAVYLGLGLVFSKTAGLMGFSYAALIAAIVRVLIFYSVGHISLTGDVKHA